MRDPSVQDKKDRAYAMLEESLPCLREDGQPFLRDELEQKRHAPEDIVSSLWEDDRFRIHAFLHDHEESLAKKFPLEEVKAFQRVAGGCIDWGRSRIQAAAIEAATGSQKILRRADGAFIRQKVGKTLFADLPRLLGKEPSAFMHENLSEEERGWVAAWLMVGRSKISHPDEAPMTDLVSQTINAVGGLHGKSWTAFKERCLVLQEAMEKGDEPDILVYAQDAVPFVDQVVQREVRNLSPQFIAQLDEKQAVEWQGLLFSVPVFMDKVTPEFQETRNHFFRHLPVPKALVELRERQVEDFLEKIDSFSEQEIRKWTAIKEGWDLLDVCPRERIGQQFVNMLAETMDAPSTPRVVACEGAGGDGQKSSQDASFRAWDKGVWVNQIRMSHGETERGVSLGLSAPFREAMESCAHELVHSDDLQRTMRVHVDYFEVEFPKYAFQTWVQTGEQVQQRTNAPIFATTSRLLHAGRFHGARARYIPSEQDDTGYRNQPGEKVAFVFEKPFAAVLNGAVVAHQVEEKGRKLHVELASMADELAEGLAELKDRLGATEREDNPNFMIIKGRYECLGPRSFYDIREMLDIKKAEGFSNDREYAPAFPSLAQHITRAARELDIMSAVFLEDQPERQKALCALGQRAEAFAGDLQDYAQNRERAATRPERTVGTKSKPSCDPTK